MHPILYQFPEWIPLLGGKALHTYGALVALGFFCGLLWVRYEATRVGLNVQKMMDLFFYVVLAAIVGSRIMYVLVSEPRWWEDPLVFIRFWEGGLVFYGGLIASVLTVVWYTLRQRMNYYSVADVFTPGIALGHAIGRLGCFAAGCCYGKPGPENSFWTVLFPQGDFSIAPYDHPIYASQLFESFGEFVLFLILFFFRKKKKFEGEVFLIYIVLYPILRSFLEIFRGDSIRGFIVDNILSTSQFISILWVVVALVLWIQLRKKHV
ncbi:MAG: prolipoprotein diacylglyceryl transferase [Deltaproteobacteria bacterium GWA2_45_12]|nr:MAG: prolipoprotein diacylglyceryl transferase [Deltaproteobacteria bacterium GWA2_45_12]